MEKFGDLITKLEGLTVLEISELVKALEEKWGISAAASINNNGVFKIIC